MHPARAWGITPAYAGKSKRLAACAQTAEGSPPRMRGKVNGGIGRTEMFGITPAYAGKRRAAVCRGGERWDHPRVCGEKSRAKMELSRNQGITPAYAGKSVLSFGACIV